MIDWANGKVTELITLVQGVSMLGAVVIVAIAYWKTRALVALLVAAFTAGVFVWTVHNVGWWQDRVTDETEIEGGAPSDVPDLDAVIEEAGGGGSLPSGGVPSGAGDVGGVVVVGTDL